MSSSVSSVPVHTTDVTDDPTALRHQLQRAGLKVTAGRLAVLMALAERPHADADAVVTTVRRTVPTTSLQAVYGILRALTEAGLLRRIEPAGMPALYERRTGDNHHHLVCTVCAAVHDVDCVHGEAPCLDPSQTHGFALAEAEVTFWGVCPECQPTASHREDRTTPTTEGA